MFDFTVHHSLYAADTPALKIIYEGISELAQEGHMPERGVKMLVMQDDGVIYAMTKQNDIVGVICYTRKSMIRTAHITLAFVEPSSRRLGVFKKMAEFLKAQLKSEHISCMTMDVHADNEVGHKAAHFLKFTPDVAHYSARIG